MTEQSLFEQLNQLNVNDHVDKKNGLSYLSWSYVHQELKKVDPNYTVKVHEYPHPEIATEQYFVPYLATPEGYSVTVSITIKGQTETETLPVLDFKNKAVPYKQADMFQINKTYKRCFVKVAALHGLGLYIYNGDVMPEQPFEAASDSEIKEVDEKVKKLAPLMKLTESQLKNKMNIPKKLSATDAEEAIVRLDNGIQYYKKNEKDDK